MFPSFDHGDFQIIFEVELGICLPAFESQSSVLTSCPATSALYQGSFRYCLDFGVEHILTDHLLASLDLPSLPIETQQAPLLVSRDRAAQVHP